MNQSIPRGATEAGRLAEMRMHASDGMQYIAIFSGAIFAAYLVLNKRRVGVQQRKNGGDRRIEEDDDNKMYDHTRE